MAPNPPIRRRGSPCLGERGHTRTHNLRKLAEWAQGIFLPKGRSPYCQVVFSEPLAERVGDYLTHQLNGELTAAEYVRWLVILDMERVRSEGEGVYEEARRLGVGGL